MTMFTDYMDGFSPEQIREMEETTKEITKIKDRLKIKRGKKRAPFLINVLENEINKVKVEAINLGNNIEVMEKAIELLNDYTFESDTPLKEAEFVTFRAIKFTDQSVWR